MRGAMLGLAHDDGGIGRRVGRGGGMGFSTGPERENAAHFGDLVSFWIEQSAVPGPLLAQPTFGDIESKPGPALYQAIGIALHTY